jgi:exodeoxyribonuclease VII small subunit
MADKTEPDTLNFEKSLTELTDIVESMEDGQLSLEQSLAQFERGITLVRTCQQKLQTAEQKVKILTESYNTPESDSEQ